MPPLASCLPQPSLGPASPHYVDHGCLTLHSCSSGEGFIHPASANLGISAGAAAAQAGTTAGIPDKLRQLCADLDARLPLAGAYLLGGCCCQDVGSRSAAAGRPHPAAP